MPNSRHKCICCRKVIKPKEFRVYYGRRNGLRVYGCRECNCNGSFDRYIDNLDRESVSPENGDQV